MFNSLSKHESLQRCEPAYTIGTCPHGMSACTYTPAVLKRILLLSGGKIKKNEKRKGWAQICLNFQFIQLDKYTLMGIGVGGKINMLFSCLLYQPLLTN